MPSLWQASWTLLRLRSQAGCGCWTARDTGGAPNGAARSCAHGLRGGGYHVRVDCGEKGAKKKQQTMTLLEVPLATADECDGAEPPLAEVLADARAIEPLVPSRLPAPGRV